MANHKNTSPGCAAASCAPIACGKSQHYAPDGNGRWGQAHDSRSALPVLRAPAAGRRKTLPTFSLFCLSALWLGAAGCHNAEPADAPAIQDAAAKKQEPLKAALGL